MSEEKKPLSRVGSRFSDHEDSNIPRIEDSKEKTTVKIHLAHMLNHLPLIEVYQCEQNALNSS